MLGIDWQQILLHLLNFAILACILYFLLYAPIKKFMKKREDYYKNIDDEANKKLEEANELKSSYDEKLNNADQEIASKQEEAYASLNNEIEAQKEAAKLEADEIVESAKKKALKEKEDIISSAQTEISQIATSMAEKIVNGSDSKYDEFLEETKEKK